jgi:uncharacterized protein
VHRPDRRNGRWGGVWTGALARILVFAALTTVLAVPLVALWSLLGLPATGLMAYAATGLVALAAIAAGAILLRVLDYREPAALGIGMSRETARHVALGWGIGVVALAAAAAALLLSGALRYDAATGTSGAWLLAVLSHGAVFAVAALMEEAIFRGYPFQVLVRAAGPVVAAVATSALFALVHARNPEVGAFGLVNIFLAGLMLAAAYLRTLSLWFATALHLGWNWATASLFDLPVSGITDFRTPLYEPVLHGPDWWSGGAFGPEGGLVGTVGFGLALLLVLRLRAVKPDPHIAAARPIVLDRERDTT